MLRRSETVLLIYFLYTIAVACWLPVSRRIQIRLAITNGAILAGYLMLGWIQPQAGAVTFIRDWLAIGLTILCYEEMGWLRPESRTYRLERQWIVWDRWFLDKWGVKAAIERLRWFPVVLEASYMLVYAMPAAGLVTLYIYHRSAESDRYLTLFLISTLLSYALFPYFPSEPPRAVFSEDAARPVNNPLRRFNLWMLGRVGIHTSVFPSAHVSGAFGVAFALLRGLPDHPAIGLGFAALASSIALATVYGRYHYLVDAVAGIGISVVAMAITVIWEQL